METALALALTLTLGGSAFAAPECALLEDGVVSTNSTCAPFPVPLNPEYRSSMRCKIFAGLLTIVDYNYRDSNSADPAEDSVLVTFFYFNKFGDWSVKNETAANLYFDSLPHLVNIVPDLNRLIISQVEGEARDTYWQGKEIRLQCTLRE